jgi:hypothetical protein
MPRIPKAPKASRLIFGLHIRMISSILSPTRIRGGKLLWDRIYSTIPPPWARYNMAHIVTIFQATISSGAIPVMVPPKTPKRDRDNTQISPGAA